MDIHGYVHVGVPFIRASLARLPEVCHNCWTEWSWYVKTGEDQYILDSDWVSVSSTGHGNVARHAAKPYLQMMAIHINMCFSIFAMLKYKQFFFLFLLARSFHSMPGTAL